MFAKELIGREAQLESLLMLGKILRSKRRT
jgi:hypothetical protein